MIQYSVVGKRVPRIDALGKVTGKAKYCPDTVLPGMLAGKILRSPFPHARVLGIDTRKAQRLTGVKAVITAKDAPLLERKPEHIFRPVKRILAADRVRYIGEELAAVAAMDEDTASEALDLIEVEYEQLPALMDPEEAMKPGSILLHEKQNNVAAAFDIVRGDPDTAFKEADQIFEDKVVTQIQHQCYLEPLNCLAFFDLTGKLTLWLGSMDPSGIRLSLAEVLQLPLGKVRIIQAYCGGAFGGKITMPPLYPIAALLTMKTARPVRVSNNREEEFTASAPRLPAKIEVKTGVKKDGTLVARDYQIIADCGAYIDRAPRIVAQMIMTPDSLYRIAHIKASAKVVYTNKTPVGAFRGFGTIQALFAHETHLDAIASRLALDPMELRLKNATRAGDLTAHGWRITSCGLTKCIQEASAAAGWTERKNKRRSQRGVGMACALYDCGVKRTPGFSGSVAFVKIIEDGKAQVISGESEYGQGWSTVAAQVAAEELGLPIEDVEVTSPDTDFTPYSMGPWGLRLTVSGGNAVRLAAADARSQLFNIAAEMLEANVEDIEVKDRVITIRGAPDKGLSVAEVASQAIFRKGGSAVIGKGIDEPQAAVLNPDTLYGNLSQAYSFGAQAVELAVDAETGRVKLLKTITAHDLGRAINPAMAEGQVEGGISIGSGYGLVEGLIWNGEKILNPNLLDYKILTAADMPDIGVILVETHDPNNPFGAKSIGQLGTMMAASAVANAIYDAVGVRVRDLPITPDKVLLSLEKKAKSPNLGKTL